MEPSSFKGSRNHSVGNLPGSIATLPLTRSGLFACNPAVALVDMAEMAVMVATAREDRAAATRRATPTVATVAPVVMVVMVATEATARREAMADAAA